ncbi:hypothetical protein ACQKJZ_18140 [Sphingomonas sp. NPDC019816]|uniref:hypothetical protein n=1 Tax=Alphaproteobacteria TaxID=28211 RepID=UPI0010551104|nr:hypothetical protein [Bosea sp. (in: a-proteobacteria)]TAJ29089.1 MAG: hypothetical protein EPO59_15680 [Bosea sp. (in: a-proteobacteria)]|tara:strand:+ start:70 stop:645 length:576 start_codon:yes stop_codon:yes gene_type:complete
MSIVFRISTEFDDRPATAATVNARQLAAFRALLRSEGERTGTRLIDPDGEDALLADTFEARVCPLALAAIARIFDYATDAITVIEEAQFRSRRVQLWRASPTGPLRMRVALTSDRGHELDLCEAPAMALLESLGLRADMVGEVPTETLRGRLANPTVQRRLREQDLDRYLPRLERLLADARFDDSSRFEWA